jgi:MSHA biogenesis protein MshI
MQLFRKKINLAGRIVIHMQQDGVCAACVNRSSASPAVEFVSFFHFGTATPASVLEKVARELHAERYECLHLLGAHEYQLLSVEAPNVPVDELKTAVRWRLKDMLDFHIDDATIDVLDVPLDKEAGNRNHSMYAVAARNQLIQQRQEMFAEANFNLRVIDIPEMAQRNIAALLETPERGLALLSFDAEGGLLTISYKGELYLSRRIDVSLAQLASSDAELKTGYLERVTLEVQRSLDHFDRQYHTITLSKLVLAGGGSAAELRAHLTENLYIPSEVLDLSSVLDCVKVPELASPDVQQRYFLALGAALRLEETAL